MVSELAEYNSGYMDFVNRLKAIHSISGLPIDMIYSIIKLYSHKVVICFYAQWAFEDGQIDIVKYLQKNGACPFSQSDPDNFTHSCINCNILDIVVKLRLKSTNPIDKDRILRFYKDMESYILELNSLVYD
jgi:hypothetical protein